MLAVPLLALAASASSLLILPPETAPGDAAAARAAEAVSDLLPHALAFLGVPVIQRADRLLALERLELPPVALTRATSIRIAEALAAPRIVVGRLELRGDALELSLRLLDTERGSLSAPFRIEGRHSKLTEIVDGVAWDLALAGAPRSERERSELLARRRPPPSEALAAYEVGLQAKEAPVRVRSLQQALALAPDFDEARLELGRLLVATRQYEEAFETLSGVQAAGLARAARFLQGRALLELGRHADASGLYAGLVADGPTAAALNNQGLALLRQARPPLRASAVLQRAIELQPADPDIAFNLGFALLKEGDPAAALAWLQDVVRTSPRDARARMVLSWALRRAGRPEEADEAWRAVLTLAPDLQPLAAADLSRRVERMAPSERRLLAYEGARGHPELLRPR